MIRKSKSGLVAVAAALVLVLAGCGSDDAETETGSSDGADQPTIVVSTNILGDVVGELVGDQAEVVTIMPVGADPHDFQASAQEVDQLLRADAVIINGSGFEEGLLDVFESARDEGVAMFEATSAIETIEFAEGGHEHDDHDDEEGHDDHEGEERHKDEEGHDDHGDEEKDEEGHGDDGHDDHDHEGADPHFFTDPSRMADAVRGIADFLTVEVDDLDEAALDAAVGEYLSELEALDVEVEELVAAIPEERRILVTNHEVFGYFADRYGFEVVGAVIPSGTTLDGASAGDLAELAELVEAEGVPAIFADTSSSSAVAETLAAEVGDIAVVELYSESLGEAGSDGATYLEMVRTNANRISTSLA